MVAIPEQRQALGAEQLPDGLYREAAVHRYRLSARAVPTPTADRKKSQTVRHGHFLSPPGP
ncbi:hypothetical protein SHKM778_60290 [Streptomyces sp. KM77-8]|uniref:Uncharacterized protein n=1 Tax=Streptomyces haneummycinicus TaxID=3074435 RepID=A0AAT9HQA3_9ACTN